VSLLSVP